MDDTGIRQITDSRVLSAMAHPLRRRLLGLLKLDGPSTATVLAERTGQAVGNISHHLHTLAAAELIEEVPELARDRREHWWRRTAGTLRWSPADFADDAASDVVFRAAESLNLDYQVSVFRQWAQAADAEHARWPAGPFSTDSWMRLTDAELAEVGAEMTGLIRRWADREVPDDGQQRDPVFVFARGIPGQP
jgi:DNA-binding transcriptional ArsR family regulator